MDIHRTLTAVLDLFATGCKGGTGGDADARTAEFAETRDFLPQRRGDRTGHRNRRNFGKCHKGCREHIGGGPELAPARQLAAVCVVDPGLSHRLTQEVS